MTSDNYWVWKKPDERDRCPVCGKMRGRFRDHSKCVEKAAVDLRESEAKRVARAREVSARYRVEGSLARIAKIVSREDKD